MYIKIVNICVLLLHVYKLHSVTNVWILILDSLDKSMQIGKCLSDRGQDIFLHKSSSDLYVLSEIFELISPEKSFTQSYKMLFYSFT